MAALLHLITLGTPQLLSTSGEQIAFRARKHLALLIRLAVEQGRSFARGYLMDLLWPDTPESRAAHSLSQALCVLRGRLGEPFLVRRGHAIGLAAGALDLDLDRLDTRDVEIRGPFLDGFDVPNAVEFAHWKDEWRGKLSPRMRDCLVAQMQGARRVGDFATVETRASTLLELDPFCEDAVRGLMVARAWVGDRTNALAIYDRLVARLANELGAKPSAGLTRIAELFRERRRPRAPEPLVSGRVAERSERRFDPEMVIGREPEFARLSDAWLDAREGMPRIVVLLGDSGVGKTTLANAFVSACQMDGAVVARAQAYDAERELPFAVLAELVKQLALQRAIGGADFEALGELARISPEILSAFPGVQKPIDWSAEVIPLRLVDSFLKAVEAATEASPLVLVVDDLHAADNASAAILHATARKLPPARLLVVMTARTNELRAALAASAFVADLTIRAIDTVELEPLPAAAAAELVAALIARGGRRVSDVPVSRILQACSGNPLALELLTKEWLAHGSSSLLSDLEAVNTQPAASLGIPRAIQTVFERQIGRLDSSDRAGLDLAAVLGRRLGDLQMYDAVGLSTVGAGEVLSRLKDAGFLREIHGALEFRNEVIRAQAYYAVAGPARQDLHRRVAERLALRRQLDEQAPSLEIAWHLLRGRDAARARPHALVGAAKALLTGAPYESEQVLATLLREGGTREEIQAVRLLLARALLDQSKAQAAGPVLEDLLSDSALPPIEAAEATRLQATAEYLLHRETGRRYKDACDVALKAATHTHDVELVARALFEQVRCGAEIGDQERVLAAQRELAHILEDEKARRIPIVFYADGYCKRFLGDMPGATRSMRMAIEVLNASSRSAVELSLVYNALGMCQYSVGDFAAAETSLLRALELARRMGDDSRSSIISSNLCVLSILRGRFEDALRFGRTSIELGDGFGNQPLVTYAYTNLADAYLLSGKRTEARQCIEAARLWNREQRSWRVDVTFLCESAHLALMMRDPSLALKQIEEVEHLAYGRELAVPEQGLFCRLRTFRAAHVAGADDATELATGFLRRFRGRNMLYYLEALAALSWLQSKFSGSQKESTRAELRLFDSIGAHGLQALLVAEGFLS